MIRWCSYCQKYLGEIDPEADFSITHGICSDCKSNKHYFSKEKVEAIQPIVKFYQSIKKNLRTEELPRADDVLSQARDLKIQPSDFLVGMIQPLLVQIGLLYEEGKVSMAQEHQFTQFVEHLLFLVPHYFPDAFSRTDSSPDVVLVCAHSNYHYLGPRIMEVILRQEGIHAKTIYPGLTLEAIEKLLQKEKPKILGVSFSLEEQTKDLEQILLFAREVGSFIVAGGQGLSVELFEQYQDEKNLAFYGGNVQGFVLLVQKVLHSAEGKGH
jgi:methanogenic corrinoid protein MtbC1